MLGGLVGDGELSQVSTDHIELDFDVVECLAVVDCDVVADHFGEDDGVPEVSLDWDWLLSRLRVLLALLAFGIESDVLVLDLYISELLLLENLLLILALNNSTTFYWLSSFIWSGVYPLKLCLLIPFSFLGAVDICGQ